MGTYPYGSFGLRLFLVHINWFSFYTQYAKKYHFCHSDDSCFLYRTSGSDLVLNPKQMCKKNVRSRPKFVDICKKAPGLLQTITDGVTLAQSECQYQFRHRRWNCTNAKKSIKKVMARGTRIVITVYHIYNIHWFVSDTRETGFVNAILAAGISFQVTRACTKGELIGCACDKHRNRK